MADYSIARLSPQPGTYDPLPVHGSDCHPLVFGIHYHADCVRYMRDVLGKTMTIEDLPFGIGYDSSRSSDDKTTYTVSDPGPKHHDDRPLSVQEAKHSGRTGFIPGRSHACPHHCPVRMFEANKNFEFWCD